MATYNLATKYETKLEERFTQASVTEKWIGSDYTFDGVNAIKTWTLDQAVINDYTLTPERGVSRFGEIREVGDQVNTYQLTKKKSFNQSFDETNVQDQMFVKKANAYLKQIWDEQFVPAIDEDRLKTWANGAGLGTKDATKLSNTSIVRAILTGHAALNNQRVPRKNRCCFVTEQAAIETRLADELKYSESSTDKQIVNGQITRLGGYPVVAVPDDLMPAGVQFMIKYKNASIDPMKMKLLRVITDSENVAGSLMQGLVRYDSFVLASKANGIYVYGGAEALAAPVITQSGNAVSITSADDGTIKYTLDGSNPKTNGAAMTYTGEITITENTTVRAYAEKSGSVNSPIAELKAVYSA